MDTKYKILMIGWEFPPHITGGLGVACQGMARALANAGHTVYFLLPHLHGDEEQIEKLHLIDIASSSMFLSQEDLAALQTLNHYPGINEVPFKAYETNTASTAQDLSVTDTTTTSEQLVVPKLAGGYEHNLFLQVEAFRKWVGRISIKIEFDIIHAHDWMSFGAASLARELSGKKMIAHIHSTEFDRNPFGMNRSIYDLEYAGLQKADHIIAVSHYTASMLHSKYDLSTDKIAIIHNALDNTMDTHHQNDNTTTQNLVLFLGRITAQKGPHFFVDAAALVLEELPDTRFVMAGDGDMLEAIIEKTTRLGISKKFHFTGFLGRSDVNQTLANSNLLLMPSVSEPFGLTALEAMSLGVPTIIAKQAGVSEIVSNCIKIDFWNVNEIADHIIQILKDPTSSTELATKAQQEVGKLTWQNGIHKLEQIYASEAS